MRKNKTYSIDSELDSAKPDEKIRKLVAAIIKRAILDILNESPIGWDSWNEKNRQENVFNAQAWIASTQEVDGDYFTFEACCSILSICPNKIREHLKKDNWKESFKQSGFNNTNY